MSHGRRPLTTLLLLLAGLLWSVAPVDVETVAPATLSQSRTVQHTRIGKAGVPGRIAKFRYAWQSQSVLALGASVGVTPLALCSDCISGFLPVRYAARKVRGQTCRAPPSSVLL